MTNKTQSRAVAGIMMALFAFSAAACFGQSGGRSINSTAALKEYLDSQPVNSPDKPIEITMGVNDLMFKDIVQAIQDAGKYVSLNLTGSPIRNIPKEIFMNNTGLVGITIPDSVTRIEERAFSGCTSLASVTIPGSVTSIGARAFEKCTSLASIAIPDGVEVIGGGMFRGCTSLASLPLPKSATGSGSTGGKIFYYSKAGFTMTDNNQVCHYLEAAPNDMPTELAWASSRYFYTSISGTGSAIGAGRKNTALILAVDAAAPAAKACKEYSNGGKTDWFLPSMDELNMLYESRNFVGNMGTAWYWSSSQRGSFNAWPHLFGNGGQFNDYKNKTYSVRAVRAF
jgi:hypothetical protein